MSTKTKSSKSKKSVKIAPDSIPDAKEEILTELNYADIPMPKQKVEVFSRLEYNDEKKRKTVSEIVSKRSQTSDQEIVVDEVQPGSVSTTEETTRKRSSRKTKRKSEKAVVNETVEDYSKIHNETRRTIPAISTFELVIIVSKVMKELEVTNDGTVSTSELVRKALLSISKGHVDYVIRRHLPDGRYEDWSIKELHITQLMNEDLSDMTLRMGQEPSR